MTIQISQVLNITLKGDGFSAKPLGKSLFHCQNGWSGHGPAGQFGVLESVLSFILVGKVFGKTFRILGLLRWKEVFVGG